MMIMKAGALKRQKSIFRMRKSSGLREWTETFGTSYRGKRSFYYMMLEKLLREGVEVDGIGMQYHAFFEYEGMKDIVKIRYKAFGRVRLLW